MKPKLNTAAARPRGAAHTPAGDPGHGEIEGEPPVRQLGAGGEEAGGVTASGVVHPEEDPLATSRITATTGKDPGKLNSLQEDA